MGSYTAVGNNIDNPHFPTAKILNYGEISYFGYWHWYNSMIVFKFCCLLLCVFSSTLFYHMCKFMSLPSQWPVFHHTHLLYLIDPSLLKNYPPSTELFLHLCEKAVTNFCVAPFQDQYVASVFVSILPLLALCLSFHSCRVSLCFKMVLHSSYFILFRQDWVSHSTTCAF